MISFMVSAISASTSASSLVGRRFSTSFDPLFCPHEAVGTASAAVASDSRHRVVTATRALDETPGPTLYKKFTAANNTCGIRDEVTSCLAF